MNFVAFVDLPGARHLVARVLKAFRNTTADPPDTVNYGAVARITAGLTRMIRQL